MSKFTKPFRGVPQGEIYPVRFAAGEECPAELVAGALSVGALSLDTTQLPASLVGSNTLPSAVPLTGDVAVSLGDVVSHAHAASGLSIEAWNALDETVRDAALKESIQQLAVAAEAGKTPGGDGSVSTGLVPDKGALIQQLEAAGIAFDKRWGVDKLAAALGGAGKD
jgi:hypothetical protein